jgi:hypothetical protein
MTTQDGAPRQPGEAHAEVDIPPTPVPKPSELWLGTPYPLTGAGRYTIGWQDWTEAKGGPGFATLRRGTLGYKVMNRYPLTDEGWAEAWQEITALDAATAEQVRAALVRRVEAEAAAVQNTLPAGPQVPPRSSPEARARILQLIKQANPKYAKPFEKDRLAGVSLFGTESWAEYGQVVLQMAILDTLLSIEDLLTQASGSDGSDEDR